MKNSLNIMYLSCSLCWISCSSNQNNFDGLNKFTNEKLGLNLSDTTLSILFIPNNSCTNCFYLPKSKFIDSIKKDKFVLITNARIDIPEDINVIYDTKNTILSFDMVNKGNTLVKVSEGKISEITKNVNLAD